MESRLSLCVNVEEAAVKRGPQSRGLTEHRQKLIAL